MKIPLTKNRFAVVDPQDFAKVSQFRWHVFSQRGYAGRDEKKKKILMHRFILDAPPGMEVDHINGDPLDNRRKNLRLCTHQQNCSNHKGYGKIKGVTKVSGRPLKKPWAAQIMVKYKRHHLGYFRTPEEAGLAYNKAARKHFGEFARLNIF